MYHKHFFLTRQLGEDSLFYTIFIVVGDGFHFLCKTFTNLILNKMKRNIYFRRLKNISNYIYLNATVQRRSYTSK